MRTSIKNIQEFNQIEQFVDSHPDGVTIAYVGGKTTIKGLVDSIVTGMFFYITVLAYVDGDGKSSGCQGIETFYEGGINPPKIFVEELKKRSTPR